MGYYLAVGASRTQRTCRVCGRPIPPGKRSDAVYCSLGCQSTAGARRRRGLPIDTPERTCPVCGEALGHNLKQVYCSRRCAWRGQRRLAAGHSASARGRTCETCGGPISGNLQINARYCSDRCRGTAWARRYRPSRKEQWNQSNLASARRFKLKLIAEYGGRCECCGEDDPDKLNIDHTRDDGKQHRLEAGSGTGTYRWLKRHGYPRDGYRLLCYNCNIGRAHNGGVCPHHGVTNDAVKPGCVMCGGEIDGRRAVCSVCQARIRKEYGSAKGISTCLMCGAPIEQAPGRAKARLMCPDCAYARLLLRVRWENDQRRRRILDHYTHGEMCCADCGEDNLRFLTIDHIAGDGAEHRRLLRLKGGNVLYKWLERGDFPSGFQVLCYSCNCKKGDAVRQMTRLLEGDE